MSSTANTLQAMVIMLRADADDWDGSDPNVVTAARLSETANLERFAADVIEGVLERYF